MFTLATLCAAIACAPAPVVAPAPAADLGKLEGTWRSPAPEPWYGGYGTREFVFANGRWQILFTHALDPAMAHRTFQFRSGGAYTVGPPSDAVPGAYRTAFAEEWKHVTLLTDNAEMIAAMGMAGCGLTPNLETDISLTGCAAWKPVAECGIDHDLLALDGEALRFGVRPADNDMCTPDRTPTALLGPVVPYR